MSDKQPTTEQITALEELASRRMANTGETRQEALNFILAYIKGN